MRVRAGDTFILTRATGSTPHLWVVLWGPAGTSDAYLMVHLATMKPHLDPRVTIRVGEHPFIQRDTGVVFGDARRTTAAKLREAFRAGEAVAKQPVDQKLLDKLRAGLLRSPRTPHAIRRMAIEEFGAPDDMSHPELSQGWLKK